MEGTVKFFNKKKGFGFVSGDDGKDYFVHISALPGGVFLRDNDRVSFDGSEGDRGAKAENVQLLQKASERDDLPQEGEEEPAKEEAPAEEEQAEEPAEEEASEEEAPEEEAPSEDEEEPAEEEEKKEE